ncbi:hypothetical protein [Vibrio vulnificus]|uniref:hypothetical protein n=1 Tax=Vibrio vulnificus TaxID=672 RepID=UPI0037DBCFD8
MNTEVMKNLTRLEADFIDAVKTNEPVRYNGNADYFIQLTERVIDTRDYELGDRKYLKNSIKHRLGKIYDKNGEKKTGFGYKKDVLPVIRAAFTYVNK